MDTTQVKKLLPDDDILDCLIVFQNRKMDAARELSLLLWQKASINMDTLGSLKLLHQLYAEFISTPNPCKTQSKTP